jgi:hypothetical protein
MKVKVTLIDTNYKPQWPFVKGPKERSRTIPIDLFPQDGIVAEQGWMIVKVEVVPDH